MFEQLYTAVHRSQDCKLKCCSYVIHHFHNQSCKFGLITEGKIIMSWIFHRKLRFQDLNPSSFLMFFAFESFFACVVVRYFLKCVMEGTSKYTSTQIHKFMCICVLALVS